MSHGSVMADYPVSVLDVQDLSVQVSSELGVQTVVNQLQFSITQGETFALVGESGCGKSMTALSLLRLLPDVAQITDGQVQFEGSDLNQWPEAALRTIRGRRISMIFQEPSTSLNPIMSIGDQLLEVILRHTAYRGQEALQNAVSWLERVGIAQAATRINDYPFQFSGGQKQRIMIAMALAAEPSLLIADEPTTALDVTIQAQILQLLKELQAELGMAILLISHDLGVVAEMAHHVALMYAGKIVSCGSATAFFDDVQHPYAQHLFSVLPHVTKRGRSLGQAWSGGQTDGSSTVQKEYIPPDPSAPLVLDIQNVSVSFPQRAGLLRRIQSWTPVVKDLSVSLKTGHTLALVGESGCGKTTLSKAILGLLDASVRITGKALIDQGDLLSADASLLKSMRQDIQIVFQDPFSSLNPRHRVGDILEEGLLTLMPNQSAQKREQRIAYLLDRVGLPRESVNRYPHEFSGGQRQRIAIARALAVEPKVLICDEPTSALDVSVQAQILNLLNELQQETGLAYLFITHNFAVVEYFAHHVAVMHEGKIIESGETLDILAHPQHDYTKRLLASVPKLITPVS